MEKKLRARLESFRQPGRQVLAIWTSGLTAAGKLARIRRDYGEFVTRM
jgi:hypothetical protein